MTFGHEWAGVVVEVGDGVINFKEGMRVRAGNSAPCFQCGPCREGKYNLCENRTWLWGAYAEYILIPARIVNENCLAIPSGLSASKAALVEPLACAVKGVDDVENSTPI